MIKINILFFVLVLMALPIKLFAICDCDPLPPPDGDETVIVGTATELQDAINDASGATTIYLQDGTYDVSSLGGINISKPDLTIRSLSGNRDAVIVQGQGMGGVDTEHGFFVNESQITIANLTIRNVANHAIIVSPTNQPSDLLFHNLRCLDTGQQIFKSSGTDLPKTNGIIECSIFEYTTTLDEGNYTNGIDLLNSHDWIIRDNIIRNIKAAPGAGLAGPAILIWHNSSNTIVERNQIIDCDMGIFFGNSSQDGIGHTGGFIKNNFIKGYENTDASIGIIRSTTATVLNNSIYSEGSLPWSIEVRYGESVGNVIMNNVMDGTIFLRDGGRATLTTNSENTSSDIFVNPAAGDLHLIADNVSVVNAGTSSPNRSFDYDCEIISDGQPDIGADEYNDILSIELTIFQATSITAGIQLYWCTESEINNAGFNVYRDGVCLNSQLIAGQGTTTIPKTYTYLDTNVIAGETYVYQLRDVEEYTLNETFHNEIEITYTPPSENDEVVKPAPSSYALHDNYPNPFNPITTITFDLPEPVRVNLSIYDIQGQLVKTLVDGEMNAGSHPVVWDGTDRSDNGVSSGVYFYTITTDNFELNKTKAMILMK